MSRIYLLLTTLTISLSIHAQITTNDSVNLEQGISKMVFYKLSNGQQTVTSATDWHIALTVRATQFPSSPLGGTTIRINEANGVKCYYVPNADASQFNNTLDTTGFRTWTLLHDSDIKLDEGALNSNRSTNVYDFGWGNYNAGSHNVVGDSLYLFELPDGSVKKFLVTQLVFDTLFQLQIADIDNSNLQNIEVNKRNYGGKMFVYLNLLNNTIYDKEPLAADWDLLFLKYTAADVQPGSYYSTTGVWQKPGVTTARAAGTDVNSNDFAASTFVTPLNTIGWNWKSFNQSTNQYEIEDSLLYFVKSGTTTYKLVFTGFGGSATGKIYFHKQDLSSVGILEPTSDISFGLYPVPTSNSLTLSSEFVAEKSSVQIYSLTGALVMENTTNGTSSSIDVSGLDNGMYVLKLTDSNRTSSKTFIIQR